MARQESLILGHRPREQNNSETINSCSCCTAATFDTTAHSPPPTAHRPSPALRTNDKPRKMKKQCAHKLSSRRCPKLHSNGLEAKTKRSGQKESQLTGKAVEKRGGGGVFSKRKMAGAVGLRKTIAHQITANNKQRVELALADNCHAHRPNFALSWFGFCFKVPHAVYAICCHVFAIVCECM